MSLLEGKTALVFGVANERSIAWGITRRLFSHGARIGLSYAGEKLRTRVEPLAEQVDASFLERCDVTDDEAVATLFERAAEQLDTIDILVHAIAYAPREELSRPFSETSRSGFHTAMDVSVYSLISLAHHAAPLMRDGGSIMTMTYYGGEKVAANYNVMGVAKAALESTTRYLAADLGPSGVRVNAISPGPIRTLSAAGVRGFRAMYDEFSSLAPMRRQVTIDDVGDTAVWLGSELAGNVTGQTIFVDGGYNVLAPGGGSGDRE
jgi:enoyl-[acyl-carrier protein] reductase I